LLNIVDNLVVHVYLITTDILLKENEIKSQLLSLSKAQWLYVLSSLAHQLTVCARQAYLNPDSAESLAKLRTFNELEHIVTGQLAHIVADQKRYSDSDFVDIVFEKARSENCLKDLQWAFAFSLQSLMQEPH